MASDIPALLPYTNQVIFLEDLEMAVLTAGGHHLSERDRRPAARASRSTTIEWNAAMAEKSGYQAFHAQGDL